MKCTVCDGTGKLYGELCYCCNGLKDTAHNEKVYKALENFLKSFNKGTPEIFSSIVHQLVLAFLNDYGNVENKADTKDHTKYLLLNNWMIEHLLKLQKICIGDLYLKTWRKK